MKVLYAGLVAVLMLFGTGAMAQKSNTTDSTRPITIGVSQTIYSKVLGETRILNIYLPEGYKPGDTARYPVIYLLDGGTDEDFLHVAGLVQFSSFPWVNRLKPSIVVGIVNVDRKRDFTFPTTIEKDKKTYPATGHSDKFMTFIEMELQPYIEKEYKTTSSKTFIGESLGGLLATEILFKKPEMFNTYIIISPSIWWDNGSLLNLTQAGIRQRTQVYIGVGKEGLTPTDAPRVMEVDANLLADKLRQLNNKMLTVYFDYLPGENHATIAHQALLDAFKMLAAGEKR